MLRRAEQTGRARRFALEPGQLAQVEQQRGDQGPSTKPLEYQQGITKQPVGLSVLPLLADKLAERGAIPIPADEDVVRGGEALLLHGAPAAVALVAAAALKLGRDVVRTRIAGAIAVLAFAAALFTHANPALILLLGGTVGALLMSPSEVKP